MKTLAGVPDDKIHDACQQVACNAPFLPQDVDPAEFTSLPSLPESYYKVRLGGIMQKE